MKKAVIDIDGVLNNYPRMFVDYCNEQLNEKFKSLQEIKQTLSYASYKAIKQAYRQSDAKHKATVSKGAKELLDYLSNNGYLVYIVTARKLFSDDCLERTVNWLKINNLRYDYMYCSAKKDFTIFEKFGHIDLFIDDNADNVNNVQAINGSNCLYINIVNDENIHEACNCIRLTSLVEALPIVQAYCKGVN